MSSKSKMVNDSEVQVGCFSHLLSFRRHAAGSAVSRRADNNSGVQKSLTAGLEVVAKDGEVDELPAYVQFANTCLYCEPGAQFAPCGTREKPPSYAVQEIYRPDVVKTIETELDRLDSELRKLSLVIWNHPEIMYEEKYAHDTLTAFMSSHGFTVSPHYLGLSTAFRAAFSHTSAKSSVSSARVLGVNAEMDALPGIGHACGHNLIAMSGVAVALALKAALQTHDIPGTVVLLGTPAEEGGGGKIALLERGAYDEMDACVMCHPSPGPDNWTALGPSLACQPIEVEYFGHGAHAAASPWEAQNALDAAFLAYAGISALRQQIKPTHRVHGVVSGRDWAPNVIPDYAKMRYIVRAPTWGELETLRERVKACFEAAAHATACKIEIKLGVGYFDLRQNGVLGQEYANFVEERYGMTAEVVTEGMRASTDFGNVTYALPAIHPSFAIPTEPNGGNHTPQFTRAAATPEAHAAALKVAKGLAAVGMRVLDDGQFARAVKKAFENAGNE